MNKDQVEAGASTEEVERSSSLGERERLGDGSGRDDLSRLRELDVPERNWRKKLSATKQRENALYKEG